MIQANVRRAASATYTFSFLMAVSLRVGCHGVVARDRKTLREINDGNPYNLRGIGHVLCARLTDGFDKVSHSYLKHRLEHAGSSLRFAALRHVEQDGAGMDLVRREAAQWNVPDSAPRPPVGEMITVSNPILGEFPIRAGDVSKDILYAGPAHESSRAVGGVAYPLMREDIPYFRRLGQWNHELSHFYTSINPEPTGPWQKLRRMFGDNWGDSRAAPWFDDDGVLFVGAETHNGQFFVKADVPSIDPTNLDRDPGGELVTCTPDVFAKQVEWDLRQTLSENPGHSLVMVCGDVGRSPLAAQFAEAFHELESTSRKIYFADGKQILWLESPSLSVGDALSVQLKKPAESAGASEAWVVY